MKSIIIALGLTLCLEALYAQPFKIHSLERNGWLTLTNTFPKGVVTVEGAPGVLGPWRPKVNVVTTSETATVRAPEGGSQAYYRAYASDLTPGTPSGQPGFTNLIHSYGLLTTIAGAGNQPADGVNYWEAQFEGGWATNAELSRPHIAMADDAGNVYIADKWAHAIRKVSTNGIITTVAGVNTAGNGPDSPTLATQCHLNEPNGLFVKGDGTLFILDLRNHKIRRVDTNGLISTILFDTGFIFVGRGLWVNEDETEIYYAAQNVVRKWTSAGGITQFTAFPIETYPFAELGNITRHPITDDLIVTDRGSHLVWRVESDGGKAIIAGNGTAFGGGDGQLALETGLDQVRTAAFLPTGGYFLGTHHGGQIWYVDTDGYIHLFVNGDNSRNTHAGDGTWFYNPLQLRMSEIRAITIDKRGDLYICEHDSGYIRKIAFLPFVEED